MSLAVVESRAMYGLDAVSVRVEVHVGHGLPSLVIVGLPDAGVRESRERVRAAIVSSGYDFPSGRITVNLAPADLPKASCRLDLPIALGILMASGQVAQPGMAGKVPEPVKVQGYIFVGDLSLTGAVPSLNDPLSVALSVARECPGAQLVMAQESAALAAAVPGIVVWGVQTLVQVVECLSGQQGWSQTQAVPLKEKVLDPLLCLSDVRGQALAKRALELAAAGGHSLLMSGPPGTGKSMLAARLPGLLPDLTELQALEVAALRAKAGNDISLSYRPPFRAPHHSASVPALIGGGASPQPGEITHAHHGVLFLDELPEFQRRVIESLREPLEAGVITVARAKCSACFPALFQLVAAMNPCACGWSGHPHRVCRCTPEGIDRYRSRLSGPFLDRLDLQVNIAPVGEGWIDFPKGEISSCVKNRVIQARNIQHGRQGMSNARLDPGGLMEHVDLATSARQMLDQAMQQWGWSARVVHRVMRVGRTIADLATQVQVDEDCIAEAIQFRQAW